MTDKELPEGAARITITVTPQSVGGAMASLSTEGAFADEALHRRFYSIGEMPPPDLPPYAFWGTLLANIGQLMNGADDYDEADDAASAAAAGRDAREAFNDPESF